MGVLKAEPTSVGQWTQRAVGVAWRAYDVQLTIYAVLLTSIGLAMAYTNSVAGGGEALGPGSVFTRGLMWAAIATIMFIAATAFDYRWLRLGAWPLYAITLGLLVLSLLIGDGVGGSARWISLFGLQFQFSELAKILMIIVLATYLAGRQGKLGSLPVILGAIILVIPPTILVMRQPDLGTSLVFSAILAGMLFMSGASLRWLLLIGGAVLAAIPFVWTSILHDYQRERLISFMNPGPDILGSGYQVYQSQIAVGSGGLLGKGLTNGTQNQLDFLPVQTTDFVFAILAEELGFVGGMVTLALIIALLWRILVSGWRSRDPFGLLFASGLASMVLFQTVVNVGMVLGIMPVTGIPLPFVTHGGASLISIAIGLGIMQSINIRQTRAEW